MKKEKKARKALMLRAVGVVEIILIIVVIIGLVLIFKSQLTDLVNSIFDTISSQAGSV